MPDFATVPIVDIGPLVAGAPDRPRVADAIGAACRECGFFYITGHGVDSALLSRLEAVSRRFFALEPAEKLKIPMSAGGRAWRGYFQLGDELTSGKPDRKEGIYFGAELPADHPDVRAGLPLHGPNLFPAIEGFREVVLEYMDHLTRVGHALMAGISLSLGLEEDYFVTRYTADPLVLFRIFHYPAPEPRPPAADREEPAWGVGEHTDYGLLTILWQDDVGGLEVKSQRNWVAAPPIPGTFICNIGDMLDRLTRGLYRSTPHRVRNRTGRDRLSFPFFFDPNFHAVVRPIEALAALPFEDDRRERWDQASVHEFGGTYGDYILGKVSKVFPQLRRDVL